MHLFTFGEYQLSRFDSTKGDDPFMLDLEWNKPVATTHPLGIDIEVRFQKFLAFRSNLFMLVKVTLCMRQFRNEGFFRSLQASLLQIHFEW